MTSNRLLGFKDSDHVNYSLLLDKETYAERIVQSLIESAKINYQFPTNSTIEVKEFDIVGYYKQKSI